VSLAFGLAARDAGIAISMGSRGCAYDKRRRRGFLRDLEEGARPPPQLADSAQVIGEVFEYIEAFYNPIPRHSTLGYLSPVAFENSTLGTGGSLAAARLASTDDKITITT
jgi:putative transposase